MKKRYIVIIILIAIPIVIRKIFCWLMFLLLVLPGIIPEETLIEKSVSPYNENMVIEVYDLNPGATSASTTKFYLINDDNNRELIYKIYPKKEFKIEWVSDDTVLINDDLVYLK